MDPALFKFLPPQMQVMLGVPPPASPTPNGVPTAQPQGPRTLTPPFLPQNMKTSQVLGQMPKFSPPAAINTAGLKAALNQSTQLPELEQMDMSLIPQRKAPQFADPSGMVNAVKALGGPKDPRLAQPQFEQERFADALSAAALAASQGDDLGQTLALAGGSFLQSTKGSDKARRAEDMMFSEAQRAHDMEMLQLDYEVEQTKADMANATSDVDFMNGQTKLAALEQRRMEANELKMAQFTANQQKVNNLLQIAEIDSRNANAQIDFQNREAERTAPRWEASPDGSTLITTYVDKNGNLMRSEEPLGITGQMKQLAEIGAQLGGVEGQQLIEQGTYFNLTRYDPTLKSLRRNVIKDLLKGPGGDNIFDPENAKAEKMKDPLDLGTVAGNTMNWAGDLWTTSKFESLQSNAEEYVKQAIANGSILPEQAEDITLDLIAQGLDPYFDTMFAKRAREYSSNPTIQYGMDLLGIPKGPEKKKGLTAFNPNFDPTKFKSSREDLSWLHPENKKK